MGAEQPAPWLSILVPVYGVSAWIEPCLRSITAQVQDDGGVELLLLDDRGPDDSWDKVQACAASFGPRMRLLRHQRNRGLSAARNTLLAEARGQYAWFVDSDDILLPGAIRSLRCVLDDFAPDLVLCDFIEIDEQVQTPARGRRHATFPGHRLTSSCDRNDLLCGLLEARQLHAWSKIARRAVWQAAPFPEGRYFEDMPTIPALAAATDRWVHAPQAWVGYRQRVGSILANMDAAKGIDLLASVQDLHAGVQAMPGLSARTRRALDYFCLRAFSHFARTSTGEALAGAGRAAFTSVFPDAGRQALSATRRRGWLLRAHRIENALARSGWLE